jgi:hypothetical protein
VVDDGYVPIVGTEQVAWTGAVTAEATRRSWFVDLDACALRIVVDRTNAGPPALREVQAIEGARDVLRDGRARDDGAYDGFYAGDAIDGTYARRWAGAPGHGHWTLEVKLAEPTVIDRVHLVLGFDATSVPRAGGVGRTYAVSYTPAHYVLEGSEDGSHFAPIASEPVRADGTVIPLRRRLVTMAHPRALRALRLVMTGTTGANGLPDASAGPVVREMSAYRADDPRPLLGEPWILSINANPAGWAHATPGGELANDVYWTKYLQLRLAPYLTTLRRDDRYARALGPRGELLPAAGNDYAGEALEAIEGDDPTLETALLAQSSPPPIAVLSGSNDWDYAAETGPDSVHPKSWHWDPLRDAWSGGMGQLAPAVKARVAPFLGFCGGAQILALLEAKRALAFGPEEDRRTIDAVLRRTNGHLIRGFASPNVVERAWPGEQAPRSDVAFKMDDPLFADIAGPMRRTSTHALPESHADVVRPDAFLPTGPLARFDVVATSAFCGTDVVAASVRDGAFPNPRGPGLCDTVPEAFRSRDHAYPVIGTQFHAEQRDFPAAAAGDPPESVADPRLFLAAAYEQIVDAYVKHAP